MQDSGINGLYKAFGYLGVIVGFVLDLEKSINDPNLSTAQKAVAVCLLVGISILAGVAVYLAGPGLLAFAVGILIMITLNYIREKIMEYIMTSSLIDNKVKVA